MDFPAIIHCGMENLHCLFIEFYKKVVGPKWLDRASGKAGLWDCLD